MQISYFLDILPVNNDPILEYNQNKMISTEHHNKDFQGRRLGRGASYSFGDGILYNIKGVRVARFGLLASGIFETLISHPGLVFSVEELAGVAGEMVMDEIIVNSGEKIQFLQLGEIMRVHKSVNAIKVYLERAESGLSEHLKTIRLRGYTWNDF